MSKETKFYGVMLTALPVIDEVREKHEITVASPGESQLEENLKYNDHVDWIAVRQDIEVWLREYPDLLPPELGQYKKMLDLQKNFPPEPVFTEPATEKLKNDVIMLYKAFLHVYNLAVMHLAAPWQKVIDNFYSVASDLIFEFVFSGEYQEVPQDWISKVLVVPILGEDVVMAMANGFSDPEQIAGEFRRVFDETFGDNRLNITEGNLATAPYLIKKLQGMVIKDIADDYIQEHRSEFPDDEELDDYKAKKRLLEERLDTGIRRLLKMIDKVFPDKNLENSVP